MDTAKSAIKSFVLDLRKTLEAEIEIGLRRYGISAGKWRDVGELKHLDDRGIADRIRMEEAIRHAMHRADDKSGEDARAEAVRWFIREIAFTHLNRLVALKVLEVRGLIPEIIQPRPEYGNRSRAHRDYREAHPAEAVAPDDALEMTIKSVCRIVYLEFRILFYVGDPTEGRGSPANSLIWPSYPVLRACIAKINELDAEAKRPGPPAHRPATPEESVWAEDEIIGWTYQFYANDEKDVIRERDNRRPRPRRPAEVAILNQFFTPRWIVKFLVDNTLGRLWLEMHPNSPRVRAKCNYLVPESSPLSRAEEAGERLVEIRAGHQSPINNPSAPPRRSPKRPQDIRLIDPACGTMHFGHYAFEVFQAIYADTREQGWLAGDDTLSDGDVPAAILYHNLYGVDIDLRAVQLAALSLFIKAKTANPQARIDRVNLVVADAYLPDGKVQEEFIKPYSGEPVIQRAFREVFESLNNVAEMGSLLRMEERFRQILEAADHPAANDGNVKKKSNGGVVQKGFAEIAPGWTTEYTIEQMLNHLREFARRALQEHDLNAQLFAKETGKSVALLDVFLHDYDVAVMNPPFGMAMPRVHDLLDNLYPDWSDNLLCAFFLRAEQLVKANDGFIGMVSDETFAEKKSYCAFRMNHFLDAPKLIAFLDLGWGILDDAYVEICTFVSSTRAYNDKSLFVDLHEPVNKVEALEETIRTVAGKMAYWRNTLDFAEFPFGALGYRAPASLLSAFKNHPKLEKQYAHCPSGGMDAPADHYYRYIWEVPPSRTGKGRDFAPFWNGYAGHSPYYMPDENVVLWYKDGSKVSEDPRSNMRIREKYFSPGLKWGKRGDIMDVAYLAGAIFSKEGQALFPFDGEATWPLVAYLNSYVAQFALNLYSGQHKTGGYVGQLPIAHDLFEVSLSLGEMAKRAYQIKYDWDKGNETNIEFSIPWVLLLPTHIGSTTNNVTQRTSINLQSFIETTLTSEDKLNHTLEQLQDRIESEVYSVYDIPEEDRVLIEETLRARPRVVVWPYAENLTREQKAAEHVARLMSYFLLKTIEMDSDGILPITEGTRHATALQALHTRLEQQFGETAAYQVETDSARYLGRPLADWLLKYFWKDYHVKWYKNRPILWQLQSAKGHFACFIYIHKMNRETLPRVRTHYLWNARNALQGELDAAQAGEAGGTRGAASKVSKLEAVLDDLAAFEKALVDVIEARVKCEIPAWAEGPYRNGMYDPLLDDGVAVNILPLQAAGLLAKNKVV